MFEKKIKDFFNSVTVCGELPTNIPKYTPKHSAALKITAAVSCTVLGALLALWLMDKLGEEESD